MARENGLVTAVVRDVDRKSLAQIARETRDLVTRARDGKMKPDEMVGGTFTISNLGMFDVDDFIAIINPPQAAILAVGAVQKVPVVNAEGQIVAGHADEGDHLRGSPGDRRRRGRAVHAGAQEGAGRADAAAGLDRVRRQRTRSSRWETWFFGAS